MPEQPGKFFNWMLTAVLKTPFEKVQLPAKEGMIGEIICRRMRRCWAYIYGDEDQEHPLFEAALIYKFEFKEIGNDMKPKIMYGTTDPNIFSGIFGELDVSDRVIRENQQPKRNKDGQEYITVFDLEAGGWRNVRTETIISLEEAIVDPF